MEKILKLYTYIDGVNDTPFPNEAQQVITSDFRSDYKRMGSVPTISCTIMHPLCLDKLWTYSVYATFNGEKFFIKHIPTSSYDNTDSRYKHELELVSERRVLENVYVYDVVSSDTTNDKPVSNSSKFVFFGTINEYAERLNRSLEYSGLDYRVVVDDGISSESKLVSFENQFFSNAIQESYNIYEIPYYYVGKEIHIGYTNNRIDHTFKYGQNESLLSIEKQNTNNRIINRITGVGSSDNIPFYYPNNSEVGELDYTILDTNGNNITNQAFVKNFNNLAKSVQVGTTYTCIDTTNYIYLNVLGSYARVTGSSSSNSQWVSAKYGDQHLGFETRVNFSSFGGVVETNTSVDYRLDFELTEDAQVTLSFFAAASSGLTPFYLSDFQRLRVYEYQEQWLGNPIPYYETTNLSGEEITLSLKKGKHSIVLWQLDVYKVYLSAGITSFTVVLNKFNAKTAPYTKKGYIWRNDKGDEFKDLSDIGVSGIEDSFDNVGMKLSTRVLYRIMPQTNLMPEIYRSTKGEERFYNALNDTYSDENGNYYEFENQYFKGNPKEHIQDFDDIKPTIKGMLNALGEPIDVFQEFAYDKDDNDEFDEEGNHLHPYFFGKLRKFDGEFGFNLFDHAIEEDEMVISMTTGSCGACEFIIGVDSDTQKNLVQVDENGNLLRDANGNVRCGREGMPAERPQERQNDTKNNEVWIALKKDINTFGVVMPNATNNYKPSVEDTFVILHIELPKSYVLAAEERLKDALIKYMHDNNSEKFTFSISFSRIFFAENQNILDALNENSLIRVEYYGELYDLYVSSYSYSMSSDKPLPEIKVELSDDVVFTKSLQQNITNQIKELVGDSEERQNQIININLNNYIRNDVDNSVKANVDFQKGISLANTKVASVVTTRSMEASSDESVYTAAAVDKKIESTISQIDNTKYLRKDVEDIAYKKIAFAEGLVAGDFLKGSRGVGMYQDSTGNWHIETDYLDVRFKFSATEVEIQKTSHIGGKVINTAASMAIVNVIETSSGYICYMNTTDDAGNTIHNTFEVGDQAYCETFNLDKQANGKVGNHFFWRLVTEVGTNYIVLSKSDCAEQSDAPLSGDDIVLLGNRTNVKRQGAIVQASAGSGSPYIRIYDKIKSYTLPKPKINLSPEGTEISADSIVLQSTGNNMEDEVGSLISVTNKLSREMDGSFYVWQGEDNTIPTLENEPAANWITEETKQEHIDDFYITTDGFCYQFAYDETTNTYSWQIVTDKYLIHFVEQIGEKRRVFVDTPTDNDVYDVGDTWVNATYADEELGVNYSNDVLVCIQAKDKGEAFSIEHWRKNSKYTDDTVANLVKKELEDFSDEYQKTIPLLQIQIDGKAETWYQDSDPRVGEGWGEDAKHVGDLWYKESTGETFYFDGTKWNEQNIPVAVFDKFDAKASIFVEKPTTYNANDLWFYEGGVSGVNYDKGTLLVTNKTRENNFVASDWSKKDKYTDDTTANNVNKKLDEFREEYNETIPTIQEQLDQKAETWYQSTDPSINWITNEERSEHVGDLWYDTQNEKTSYWDGSKWNEQKLPTELFDTLDGKSSIFVSKPSKYKKNDMWILEADYTLSDTYLKAGVIVFANQDSDTFNSSHWEKYDRYTDDSALTSFINNEYSKVVAQLNSQLDKKAETWYQDADPRTSSSWGSNEERIGDMWCTTDGKTRIWNGSEWMNQGVPDEVFDEIDGKSSIFVEIPDTGYQARDMWILEKDYILFDNYEAGTIVIATADYNKDIGFVATDWVRFDSYANNKEVVDIKDNLQGLINKVNSELGGSFYIWQGETTDVPTLNNEPAINWTDDTMRQAHVDDFYISSDGVVYQFQNANGVFGWVKVDDKYIIAYIEQMRSQLLKTGIDIDENIITVTAGQFKVQDRLGKPIAIFEVDTTTGLPTIKGEYLHVNYVNIADKKILLNPDGSGHVASSNIAWDKEGNVKFKGSIADAMEILGYGEPKYISFETGFNFNLRNFGGGELIYLPSPENYVGVVCKLFNGHFATTRSYYGMDIKIANNGYFIVNGELRTTIDVKVGMMATLYALKGYDANSQLVAYWYVENPETIE